jgi:virulence-associated protein VagC
MLTCLIECFRYPDNHVDLYKHDPYFVIFPISRRLTLLDVESDWIARTAVGNGNVSTGDQDVAQKWSLAIYEHYNEDRNSFYKDEYARSQPVSLDGIMYRCKGRPSFQSVALYERSQDALTSPPLVDDPLSAEWFRDHIEQQCADVGLGILPRPLSAGGTITAISA